MAPSAAPFRTDLNTPFGFLVGFDILGLGVGLLMGVGSMDLNSFLMPDVEGVADSILIFFSDGGSFLILNMLPPCAGGCRWSPLMIYFNKFSAGLSAMPLISSVPWYTVGPLFPVHMHFTNQSGSADMWQAQSFC